mgnify:CR=1 FL=1
MPELWEWNTYVEEIVTKEPAVKRPVPGIMEGNKIRPVLLRDITTEEEARIDLKDDELNRVLGGGLVKGSLVLIGGEPGIGKSTCCFRSAEIWQKHIIVCCIFPERNPCSRSRSGQNGSVLLRMIWNCSARQIYQILRRYCAKRNRGW